MFLENDCSGFCVFLVDFAIGGGHGCNKPVDIGHDVSPSVEMIHRSAVRRGGNMCCSCVRRCCSYAEYCDPVHAAKAPKLAIRVSLQPTAIRESRFSEDAVPSQPAGSSLPVPFRTRSRLERSVSKPRPSATSYVDYVD